MILKTTRVLLIILALSGCVSVKKQLTEAEQKLNHHIGFALYDPVKKEFIEEYQSDRYFTPASNTKVFTFYTALTVLGDSIPAFRYREFEDFTVVFGTGDPSFLHPDLPPSNAYDFLRNAGKIVISTSNFNESHFGPGWAWDDYSYGFSPERTAFPVHGNVIRIRKDSGQILSAVSPRWFTQFIEISDSDTLSPVVTRNLDDNTIVFNPILSESRQYERDIPFRFSESLLTELLSDTLGTEVRALNVPFDGASSVFYSIPVDSVYSLMMKDSDNFLAEQLLLVCSGVLSDTLRTDIAIDHMLETKLSDLPDRPRWVDGSGLSRYNLFTPRTMVRLWEKILAEVPRERLFSLIPAGGKSGTLKNWYKADPPFVYGKTGTLSNNHSLSGFILTASGRTLIFSYMNSNYVAGSSSAKKEMEKILKYIHEKF